MPAFDLPREWNMNSQDRWAGACLPPASRASGTYSHATVWACLDRASLSITGQLTPPPPMLGPVGTLLQCGCHSLGLLVRLPEGGWEGLSLLDTQSRHS